MKSEFEDLPPIDDELVKKEDIARKISDANTGKVKSNDVKEKISEANKGKRRTEAMKRLSSEMRKGIPAPPEKIAKLRAAVTGVPKTDEHKAKAGAKISAANEGKTRTPEQKAARSEMMRRTWAERKAKKESIG